MATDTFLINPSLPVRNGLVVVLPQPGQIGKAGLENQGSGGFVLSYPVAEPDRVQDVPSLDTAEMWAGGRFRGEIEKQPLPMSSADMASAVAADATVHYVTPSGGLSQVISGIAFGYGSTPSAGSHVRIEDGAGNVVFKQPVSAAGFNQVLFEPEKRGKPNTDLFIILSNGGASVSGNVSCLGHWYI